MSTGGGFSIGGQSGLVSGFLDSATILLLLYCSTVPWPLNLTGVKHLCTFRGKQLNLKCFLVVSR